jgi:hypothetical protein
MTAGGQNTIAKRLAVGRIASGARRPGAVETALATPEGFVKLAAEKWPFVHWRYSQPLAFKCLTPLTFRHPILDLPH